MHAACGLVRADLVTSCYTWRHWPAPYLQRQQLLHPLAFLQRLVQQQLHARWNGRRCEGDCPCHAVRSTLSPRAARRLNESGQQQLNARAW